MMILPGLLGHGNPNFLFGISVGVSVTVLLVIGCTIIVTILYYIREKRKKINIDTELNPAYEDLRSFQLNRNYPGNTPTTNDIRQNPSYSFVEVNPRNSRIL